MAATPSGIIQSGFIHSGFIRSGNTRRDNWAPASPAATLPWRCLRASPRPP
ncbi:MAG: hypothetical protein VKM92_03305 [Cyanobacteriota bacterium]|nr:hypothetical protein [Cyanobacteriota bacterium]